jgi:hypothetical protein
MDLLNLWAASDARVCEDIVFVRAGRGKFAEDGALVSGSKPVQVVGRQGRLVARPEDDFMPGCEYLLQASGRIAIGLGDGSPLT